MPAEIDFGVLVQSPEFQGLSFGDKIRSIDGWYDQAASGVDDVEVERLAQERSLVNDWLARDYAKTSEDLNLLAESNGNLLTRLNGGQIQADKWNVRLLPHPTRFVADVEIPELNKTVRKDFSQERPWLQIERYPTEEQIDGKIDEEFGAFNSYAGRAFRDFANYALNIPRSIATGVETIANYFNNPQYTEEENRRGLAIAEERDRILRENPQADAANNPRLKELDDQSRALFDAGLKRQSESYLAGVAARAKADADVFQRAREQVSKAFPVSKAAEEGLIGQTVGAAAALPAQIVQTLSLPGMATLFTSMAQDSLDQVREVAEKNKIELNAEQQAAAYVAGGAVGSVLERIGIGKIIGDGLAKNLAKKQIAKEVVQAALAEGLTELAQGISQSKLTESLTDIPQESFSKENIQQALVGVIVGGGASAGIRGAAAFSRRNQTEAFQEPAQQAESAEEGVNIIEVEEEAPKQEQLPDEQSQEQQIQGESNQTVQQQGIEEDQGRTPVIVEASPQVDQLLEGELKTVIAPDGSTSVVLQPSESPQPEQATSNEGESVAAEPLQTITPEAAQFLEELDQGQEIPQELNDELRRIAVENEIQIGEDTSPEDVVNFLRDKRDIAIEEEIDSATEDAALQETTPTQEEVPAAPSVDRMKSANLLQQSKERSIAKYSQLAKLDPNTFLEIQENRIIEAPTAQDISRREEAKALTQGVEDAVFKAKYGVPTGGSGIKEQPQPGAPPFETQAFSLPAIVRLLKNFGGDIKVNSRMKDLESFSIKKGIQVKKGLARDQELAADVVAHGIGHNIDSIQASGLGKKLGDKIDPLSKSKWRKVFPELLDSVFRQEAIEVSKNWRPNYSPTDSYRNSNEELYADFISAVLNAPKWTESKAPNLFFEFFKNLNQKPEVAKAYNALQNALRGGSLTKEIRSSIRDDFNKSIDELIKLAPKSKGLKERTKEIYNQARQEYLNRWSFAARREGQLERAKDGDSITDQLGRNEGYQVRQSELLKININDKIIQPLKKEGIDESFFKEYLTYNRILNENTATGRWIKQNPNDARELMRWMAKELEASDILKNAIQQAPDNQLYNIGAKLARELEERPDIESQIEDLEKKAKEENGLPEILQGRAEKFLTAFNVRGFMFNTQGINPDEARNALADMKNELGAEKYNKLTEIVKEFHNIRRPIVERAISLGRYSEETANEILLPNLDNYIPFQVQEYFNGDITTALKKGKGTTKALVDPLISSTLQLNTLLGWIQRQQSAKLIKELADTPEFAIPYKDLGVKDIRTIKKNPEKGYLQYWENGKPHVLEFDEPEIGKAVDYFDELGLLGSLGKITGGYFGQLYTRFSPSFFAYTNPLRDFFSTNVRFFKDIPSVRKNSVAAYRIAKEYARYATDPERKTPLSEQIKKLIDEGAFPAPSQTLGRGLREADIRNFLNVSLSARDFLKGKGTSQAPPVIKQTIEAVKYVDNLAESIFNFSPIRFIEQLAVGGEIFNKALANEILSKKKDVSDAERVKLVRLVGIPNFDEQGGLRSNQLKSLFLFVRPILQGYRAQRTFMLNPKTRGGYAMGISLGAVPKFMMYAAEAGILTSVFASLFGESGKEMGEKLQAYFKNITRYKKENTNIIPLFTKTSEGEWKFIWNERTSVQDVKDGLSVGLRIPLSEEGRLYSTLFYNLFTESDKDARSPSPAKTFGSWASNLMLPLQPVIKLASSAQQFLAGQNYVDPYRGYPVVNSSEWDAGGWDRLNGIAKYYAAELTGGLLNFNVAQDRLDLSDEQKNTLKIPGTQLNIPASRAMFTVDKFAAQQQRALQKAEEARINAKTRLALGQNTRRLINMGNQLQEVSDKNAVEEEQYQIFRDWQKQYYNGKPLSRPGAEPRANLQEAIKESMALIERGVQGRSKEEKEESRLQIEQARQDIKLYSEQLEEKAIETLNMIKEIK